MIPLKIPYPQLPLLGFFLEHQASTRNKSSIHRLWLQHTHLIHFILKYLDFHLWLWHSTQKSNISFPNSFLWFWSTRHPCNQAFQMLFHITDVSLWSNIFHKYHWWNHKALSVSIMENIEYLQVHIHIYLPLQMKVPPPFFWKSCKIQE